MITTVRLAAQSVWDALRPVVDQGHPPAQVFSDWLDACLAAHLSWSDNLRRNGPAIDLRHFDGPYEARYMAIVARYADGRPKGQRAMGRLLDAYVALHDAVASVNTDVLGDLYATFISPRPGDTRSGSSSRRPRSLPRWRKWRIRNSSLSRRALRRRPRVFGWR